MAWLEHQNRRRRRSLETSAVWSFALAVVWLMFGGPAIGNTVDASKAVLEANGIESGNNALHAFFASMNPQGDVVQLTRDLLVEIGAEDFSKRENATKALLAIPQLPREIVQVAVETGDPEVRWRARYVLSQSGGRSKRLLRAALNVIAKSKLSGFAQDIVDCVHFYDSVSLRRLALQAMLATVQESDRALLVASANHKNSQVRIYSVRGLVKILGNDASNELRPFLKDENEQVRVYAAAELANQGDRDALRCLVGLLHSTDISTRSRSVQLLRKFTEQKFAYVAYGPIAGRSKAAEDWRLWLENDGLSAQIKSDIDIDDARLGRILVCYYNTNTVIEYDEAHNEVWKTSVPQPWGCQGLPNGHRLIASYASSAVIEFDANGEEIWRASLESNPSSAQRLEDGNTLVSLYGSSKIVEISIEKKVVRSIKTPGPVAFAMRTEDGHTLAAIAAKDGVVEFDEHGKMLKSVFGGNSFSCRRLRNGNLLVADSSTGHAREFDENKKEIWSKAFSNPLDAYRLDNGNTIVAHQNGITEIGPSGEEVWKVGDKGQAIRISYY